MKSSQNEKAALGLGLILSVTVVILAVGLVSWLEGQRQAVFHETTVERVCEILVTNKEGRTTIGGMVILKTRDGRYIRHDFPTIEQAEMYISSRRQM